MLTRSEGPGVTKHVPGFKAVVLQVQSPPGEGKVPSDGVADSIINYFVVSMPGVQRRATTSPP